MKSRLLLAFCLCVAVHLRAADTNAPIVPVVFITNAPYILTPPAPATPRINGPDVFGVRPGSPFLYTIPATGDRPMTFSAKSLPRGLKVDSKTGRITGQLKKKGESVITLTAKNKLGTAQKKFRIVVGDQICADAADGLEQLELLRQRGQRRPGEERGGRDGQERPHQPRLDLHQRGRLLAEPSRADVARPARVVPRHQWNHRAEFTFSRT